MKEEAILEKLDALLDEKRLQHSIGVKECAEKLALLYNEDTNRAALAGLLHDCAKGFDGEELIKKSNEYGVELDEISIYQKDLIHGPLGAKIAEHVFGIGDPSVLSAIEYHTYGKKDMTVLEKIIYLADLIEPNRHYNGIGELRVLAWRDLDGAVLKGLESTIVLVISRGGLIHPNTLDARNDLIISRKAFS